MRRWQHRPAGSTWGDFGEDDQLGRYHGLRVILKDVDGEAAKASATEIEPRGQRVDPIEADVSSSESVQGMTDEALARFGRLDVLVNNAGVFGSADTQDLSDEDWDRLVGTHLGRRGSRCRGARFAHCSTRTTRAKG
jgi:NAD(P)-dependent dehydrogenase (short-subunit alcohol dehydrogenase family)